MNKFDIAARTVSPNAFFWMIMDVLASGTRMSCVRMADGERAILEQASKQSATELLETPFANIPGWVETYGLKGITAGEAKRRINYAAVRCTHFAPSVSGLRQEAYNLYGIWPRRDFYIDNFFVDQWNDDQKAELFKTAGHVLFIHRNAHTADSMQIRAQANLGVKVHFLKLDNWTECDDIIERAATVRPFCDAPLVLFSGGPAGKFIGPEITRRSKKPRIVLDIGHGADKFTFSHLPMDRKAAEEFHAQWTEKQK